MREPQSMVDEVNQTGELNIPGLTVHQNLVAVWRIRWTGGCVDPRCRHQDHAFQIGVVIGQPVDTILPVCKLAIEVEGMILNAPLTRERIGELIADLTEALDELP